MAEQHQLVWFRSDLRVQDNPALYHASQRGSVVGVYFLFPQQWLQHGDSPNKLWFRMQSLQALKESLASLNIPLIVKQLNWFNEAPDALLTLIKELNCRDIWLNREYEFNECKRDKNVKQLLDQYNVQWHASVDQTLFVPGSVRNAQGQYFKVYTPFKKSLYKLISIDQLTPLPTPVKQEVITTQSVSDVDFQHAYTPSADSIDPEINANEVYAHQQLEDFLEQHASEYKNLRDTPSLNGTSGLSSFLVTGLLSIKQCFYTALLANNNELGTGNQGLACWMNELIWREFYKHILYGYPRVSMHQAFIKETEQLPWSQDVQLLQAWQSGKTGFPLVDAAMKQLVQTGWMHNRLRMVTAMFLSKNLMLDWRLGERFFMEHLMDGDLSANNGGWQWSASTGTDAAPYFRMFNPVSQSQKFDPDGNFIRQWLPQLKELDSKTIHEPWKAKHPIENYPTPIVDHAISRARMMNAFKQLKASRS